MVPNQYQAIELQRFADSFKAGTEIVTKPLPSPGDNDVVVRNLYCGINGIFDTQITKNAVDYVKVSLPTLTGVEALGVVEAVGDKVSGLAVGDHVVTTRFPSGYRQWNIGDASNFIKVKDGNPHWLVLASTGVSAYVALTQVGQIKAGETVAISAAAGGLGHLLIQIAKSFGCHVIAICGGDKKGELARQLGADDVINYREVSVRDYLCTHYKDKLDIAFDTVSGPIHDAFLDNLAVHGRLIVAGAAEDLDGKPELVTRPRIAHKLYYKGASVRSFMNGLLTEYWPNARDVLFSMYEKGELNVVMDDPQFEGLEGVYQGVERLISGQSMGKVMVKLDQQ
ncbi:zinc-binding dehydrogenase [Alteromonas sp. C1M14]|uniref:zinc-binding dehydrogenase n=1 Tax=Alteromonas sp. C1M14 TaxID=2841567 RepID=UPI001C0A5EC7|nr:zinc-binding dehydrogenase [Alteromonas sp. C1M14]MBU2980049.1 zinc-binding dehydrogenase [Alteromonas sp. C1M14]